MAIQPFYQRAYTIPSNATLSKSITIHLNPGDFIVYFFFGSDTGMTPNGMPFITNASGANNWTLRASEAGVTGYGNVYCYTSYVPTNINGGFDWTFQHAATYSGTGGTAWAGHVQIYTSVADYRDWWANRNSGAPLLNATMWEHNSVYAYACVDWNVRSGSTRAYRIPSGGAYLETLYAIDAQQTIYGGCFYNLGEPGVKTVGITTPSTMKWSELAIELKGPLNPKSYVLETGGTLSPVSIVGLSKGNGTTETATVTLT